MELPPVAHAVVVSQDPANYSISVMVLGAFGGQMPSLPVKVGTHGPRDGVRGNFPELPQVGNTGIVVFPRSDIRNGVWISTFEPALPDASPYQDGMTGVTYSARYSGAWDYHGPDGTTAAVLPDGTSFLAGAALPTPTRHTLDGEQKRQATEFTMAQRRPAGAAALPLALQHASGASAALDAAGTMNLVLPAGQTMTITIGATTIVATQTGVTITTPTFTVDGNVMITGTMHSDGAITSDGEVTSFNGGGSFNNLSTHRHPANNTPPTPGT